MLTWTGPAAVLDTDLQDPPAGMVWHQRRWHAEDTFSETEGSELKMYPYDFHCNSAVGV